ncbi:hypothetical protein EGT36_11085 [Agrobacterium sp. FDAARGOS_525]|nr:hypothetical protein EGT36_11085 [Agrobacterium sp. FDAARGOS_525]
MLFSLWVVGGRARLEWADHPPLSCRTSPPQGGRSTCGTALPISMVEDEAVIARPADLPPCGGDARQGRGG